MSAVNEPNSSLDMGRRSMIQSVLSIVECFGNGEPACESSTQPLGRHASGSGTNENPIVPCPPFICDGVSTLVLPLIVNKVA
jgi:hypothetical protein